MALRWIESYQKYETVSELMVLKVLKVQNCGYKVQIMLKAGSKRPFMFKTPKTSTSVLFIPPFPTSSCFPT
jgi:hypothetical protein